MAENQAHWPWAESPARRYWWPCPQTLVVMPAGDGVSRHLGSGSRRTWTGFPPYPVLEVPTQYNLVFGNTQPSIGGPNPVQPSIRKTRNPVLEAPTQYNPVFGKPATQYWKPQPSTTQYLENPQPSIGGPNPVQPSIRKTRNPVLEAPTQYNPVFGKPVTQYWKPQPSTTQYSVSR